jgi:hypothetical protein
VLSVELTEPLKLNLALHEGYFTFFVNIVILYNESIISILFSQPASTRVKGDSVMLWAPDEHEFLALPSDAVYDLVYPRRLSVSLLLNGTRRWYVSQYFDTPPTDNSYFPHYLQVVLEKLTELIAMLAENGV